MDKNINTDAKTVDETPMQESAGAPKTKTKTPSPDAGRLGVAKTYKLYINGKFPRTESGRYIAVADKDGKTVANICRASRKDFREAVVAARSAVASWSGATAYLRGQILYRIAEMLEGRSEQFVSELMTLGATKRIAQKEVKASIDCLVYYAGWADKFQQVFSAVNPVASSHFNFSLPEPVGVVAALSPQEGPLLGLVSDIAPVIAGGNTIIALTSEENPLCGVSFAEVLHSSDVPAGVVNILSGLRSELVEQFASHMDVNAIVYNGDDADHHKSIQELAAGEPEAGYSSQINKRC